MRIYRLFECVESDLKNGRMDRRNRLIGAPFCLRYNKTDKILKFDLHIDDILNEIKEPKRL